MIGYHYNFGEEDSATPVEYIVEFIIAERANGTPDNQIRQMLLQTGEVESSINAAFAQLNAMQKSDEGKGGNGKTASKPTWFWPAVIGGSAVGLFAIWKMVKR